MMYLIDVAVLFLPLVCDLVAQNEKHKYIYLLVIQKPLIVRIVLDEIYVLRRSVAQAARRSWMVTVTI